MQAYCYHAEQEQMERPHLGCPHSPHMTIVCKFFVSRIKTDSLFSLDSEAAANTICKILFYLFDILLHFLRFMYAKTTAVEKSMQAKLDTSAYFHSTKRKRKKTSITSFI